MERKSICKNKKFGKEFAYILGVARESYVNEHPEEQNPTEEALVRYILRSFNAEHNNEYYRKRGESLQERIADWLSGLPSACSLTHETYHIAEIGKEWDISENEEYLYGAFQNFWWKRCAFRIIQMAMMLNVPVYSLHSTDKVEL